MSKYLKVLLVALSIALLYNINHASADQIHRVKEGETLYSISQKYGVHIDNILAKNKFLLNPNNLYSKQVVIIPEGNNTYQVKPGDTLHKISQNLGISAQALAIKNQINDWNKIITGQVLLIPTEKTYKVKPGDTLFKISEQQAVSLAALLEKNNLKGNYDIYPGQMLLLPPKIKSPSTNETPQPQQDTIYSLAREFNDTLFIKAPPYQNKIALTFDDGPDGVYTNQVLEVLKNHDIPATFFLMGKRASEYPDVVNKIVQEGHVIGNHSWSHAILSNITRERYDKEILETENLLHQITGLKTALIRPPYGSVSRESLLRMQQDNYRAVNWSSDSLDWEKSADVDKILINSLKDTRPGAILLFHSAGGKGQSLANTIAALPELIHTLQVQGYEFVTTDELLSIPAYK